jgi:hypothetical protein
VTRAKVLVFVLVRLLALAGLIFNLLRPDYSLAALWGAVVVYLGTYTLDYWNFILLPKKAHPHDLELYQKVLAALNPEKFFNGLGQTTLGTTFRDDLVRDSLRFVDSWGTPDKEFIDRRIQAAFADLYSKAKVFGEAVAKYTVGMGIGGELLTTKDTHVMGEQPRAYEEAQLIAVEQDRYIASFREFIRLARKDLVPEAK